MYEKTYYNAEIHNLNSQKDVTQFNTENFRYSSQLKPHNSLRQNLLYRNT